MTRLSGGGVGRGYILPPAPCPPPPADPCGGRRVAWLPAGLPVPPPNRLRGTV
ncbi:hypothetical protein HC928_05325 [bacterium]|nr:hypothetical protein [bacterium]